MIIIQPHCFVCWSFQWKKLSIQALQTIKWLLQNVNRLIIEQNRTEQNVLWPHAPLLDWLIERGKINLPLCCQPTCTNKYASSFPHYIWNTPFVFYAQRAGAHRMCPFRMTQRAPCALFLNAPLPLFQAAGNRIILLVLSCRGSYIIWNKYFMLLHVPGILKHMKMQN